MNNLMMLGQQNQYDIMNQLQQSRSRIKQYNTFHNTTRNNNDSISMDNTVIRSEISNNQSAVIIHQNQSKLTIKF